MNCSLRLLLTRAECGRLLGIKGENIQKIRKNTTTTIHLDKDNSKERVLSMSGSEESVVNACDLLLDCINSDSVKMGKSKLRL